MSDMLRITGMATGMDTDTMVKKMMKPYTMKVDKLKQNRQLVQWRQDLYRDIMKDIKGFTDKYFDRLNQEDYMLSSNSYSSFDITTAPSVTGNPVGVSVTAGAGAKEGTYKVEVDNLASAAVINGKCIVSNQSSNINLGNWQNGKIGISISDSSVQEIDLTGSNFSTEDQLKNVINAKIQENSSLRGKVQVSLTGGKLQFNATSFYEVKMDSAKTTVTDLAGIKGKVINPTRSTTLANMGLGSSGSFKIMYNGMQKEISVDPKETMDNVIDKIFKTTNGDVTAEYSELNGTFTLKTGLTGSAASISISESGSGVLAALGLKNDNATGCNASVKITPPGQSQSVTVEKSNNIFNIDGVTYDLKEAGTITNVTVASNINKTFDKITGFIGKYNELIDKINKKVEEKKSKGYLPLTDEQKKEMKPEEIEKWEARAKEGLLKSDSNLQNMLTQLRSAFFAGVEDAGMSITELGLSTSTDTTERGKIVFDTYADKNGEKGEARLKRVLKEKGEKVVNLFTQQSKSYPLYTRDLNSTERETRTKEEGILHRINDILEDYTTTKLDKGGFRGILVEKAGIKGTTSELKNSLYKDLYDKDKKIKELEKQLITRENKYYTKFAQLEKAMNALNSQSSWLAQQLGGGR